MGLNLYNTAAVFGLWTPSKREREKERERRFTKNLNLYNTTAVFGLWV